MTESKPILLGAVLGMIVAITLITGLNALSQPVGQPVLETAAPSSTFLGQTGGANSRSQVSAATTINPWQFFPVLLTAFIVAFAGYTYARVKLG